MTSSSHEAIYNPPNSTPKSLAPSRLLLLLNFQDADTNVKIELQFITHHKLTSLIPSSPLLHQESSKN